MKIEDFRNKDKQISVIGLGYVGLPIALELAKHFKVIGFDISEKRVEMMRNQVDPSSELSADAFKNSDIFFTSKIDDLKDAHFHIVAVPTPVDQHRVPDLTPLIKASESIGKIIKAGDYVVYESTVYPGCTEEDCIPIIEKKSKLKFKKDFKVGYSPERINPGDTKYTLTNVMKIVSGCDDESLDLIAKVYETIIKPGVHRASCIKVAEAAKVIENTQRDLNIALMNELSQIFSLMNINTYEVLEAAGTKWNFLKFYPGLVGGHCIGVDPYYLTYKSMELGYEPRIILSGRRINDGMAAYIVKKVVQKLLAQGKNVKECKILIMGATFKEDVSDIRNSKIFDMYREFENYSLSVDIIDPHASNEEVKHEYGVELTNTISNDYDAVVVAVSHKEYFKLKENDFKKLLKSDGVLLDIKNIYGNNIKEINYWTL